ncbi:MAG: rhodanese-like domain-containing protein [Acidobacteriota bacterium]
MSTAAANATRVRAKKLVTPYPAGSSSRDAQSFFEGKLAFETDPADVHHDLSAGVAAFTVLDVRRPEAYEECRVPGSVNLPVGRIRESTVQHLDRDAILITYCWGPGCNASTKAAAGLAALGFTVREMIGGLEYWRREGYSVEGTEAEDAPLAGH